MNTGEAERRLDTLMREKQHLEVPEQLCARRLHRLQT